MADFTIGEDFQAVINGPFGEIQLPLLTMFSYEQVTATLDVDALDGLTHSRIQFKNWTGSISFARVDATLDNYALQLQDTCLSNAVIPDGSIDCTIFEQDGSTTNITFNNVTMTTKSLGNYAAKKTVMQGINFKAQTRS